MKRRYLSAVVFVAAVFLVDMFVCELPALDLYRKNLSAKPRLMKILF